MIVGCLSFDFRRVRLLEFQCRGTSVVIRYCSKHRRGFSHGTCRVHWASGQCIGVRRRNMIKYYIVNDKRNSLHDDV